MPLNDNLYRTFHKYNTFFILIALGIFIYSKYELKKLPDPKQISSKMYQEPVQSPTIRQKFNFPYEGSEYVIEPVADYTISGMIVTHNNISSITDDYHTSKSVDIKVLCV